MEMQERRIIAADRATVWAALLDADVLRSCLPGCTEMRGSPAEGYAATVVQKVGPVKATFKGHIALRDVHAPERLRIEGEGKGGAAGFAKGGADLRLSTDGAGTVIEYDVDARVGGKLAQLGSRVIDGFAAKLADRFFNNFKTIVEGGEAPQVLATGDATAKKNWLGRLVSG